MQLAYAVALSNNTFFHKGLKKQFEDLQAMDKKPNDFTLLYDEIIKSNDIESIKRLCGDMLENSRAYFNIDTPVNVESVPDFREINQHNPDYNNIASAYEEFSSIFNKIYYNSVDKNYIVTFLSAVYLQRLLDEINVVFNNLNLKIHRNDFVMLIGANGTGKSTLLNIISGKTNLTSGKILLNNQDITKQKEYERAKKIGKVFQNPTDGICEELTILENFSLFDNKGNNFSFKKAIKSDRIDCYKRYLQELDIGLEDRMNEYVRDLSGGQKQLLSIKLAILPDIDILLLDEPTASLDPNTSDKIMKAIDKMIKKNNLTAIMVTHDLNYAINYGNRIVMVNNKKIEMDLSGEEKLSLKKEDIFKLFININ